jgi:poly(3-hydroxybutyrate) depolymerase
MSSGSEGTDTSGGDASESDSAEETTTADPSTSGSSSTSSGTTGDESTTATTEATTGPPPNGTPGCGMDPSSVSSPIEVDGTDRTFILRLPSNYDPNTPTPLVFAWHGLGGSAAGAQLYFGIDAQIGDAAIIAYPDALPLESMGGSTGWELEESGRDVAFFDAMVDTLTEGLCIDSERIFSTGHSFGGYMSNTLGCFRSDVLRAIAPVAGGGPFGSCNGSVAAWLTHGEADSVVPLSQGEGSRDHWLSANGCQSTTEPTAPAGCEAYEGCGEDTVIWCPHPGGHEWPSFAPEAIWGFFAGF